MSLNGFVLLCMAIDTVRHRRVHPAFGWGGAIVLVALDLTYWLAMTHGWQAFGALLLR